MEPEKKNRNLAPGFIFLVVGIIMLVANHDLIGGIFFIILGVAFLSPAFSKKTTGVHMEGTAPTLREGIKSAYDTLAQAQTAHETVQPQVLKVRQAAAEDVLRTQALSPDARPQTTGFVPPLQQPAVPQAAPPAYAMEAEDVLRTQALSPDARPQATGFAPPLQEPAVPQAAPMDAEERRQRKDELKGLLESGIITTDEYRDRLRQLH